MNTLLVIRLYVGKSRFSVICALRREYGLSSIVECGFVLLSCFAVLFSNYIGVRVESALPTRNAFIDQRDWEFSVTGCWRTIKVVGGQLGFLEMNDYKKIIWIWMLINNMNHQYREFGWELDHRLSRNRSLWKPETTAWICQFEGSGKVPTGTNEKEIKMLKTTDRNSIIPSPHRLSPQ